MALHFRVTRFTDFDYNTGTTSGCGGCCPFSFTSAGSAPSETSFYFIHNRVVIGCRPIARSVSVVWDSFSSFKNRFIVYTPSTNLYDTGCVTGSGSTTFTIPAGSEQITFQVYGLCDAPYPTDPLNPDMWSIVVSCS